MTEIPDIIIAFMLTLFIILMGMAVTGLVNLKKTKRYREDCRRKLNRLLWEQELFSERLEQVSRCCRRISSGSQGTSVFLSSEKEKRK